MNLPVIESTTSKDNGQGILLPWPCNIEDLRRSIGETPQECVSTRSG
jgi:hypothetical protein